MQRSLLMICFCLINTVIIQAQNSSRFPIDPAARWKILFIENNEGDSEPIKVKEVYEYFIENDTAINSVNYYKLLKTGTACYDAPFYYERIYVGALRDEDNKFYFVKKGKTSETLLHDFNLKLGDTIRTIIGDGYIINHIDTLPDERKVFFSVPEFCGGCCTTISIIEGIGHGSGLTEEPGCTHIGYHGFVLDNYSVNDDIVYQSDNDFNEIDCEPGSYKENVYKNPEIKIYPVPSKYFVIIENPDANNSICSVEIYNILGSKTKIRKIENTDNRNLIQIDISNLKKGIYLIRISDGITSYGYKFIIEL